MELCQQYINIKNNEICKLTKNLRGKYVVYVTRNTQTHKHTIFPADSCYKNSTKECTFEESVC